MPSLLVQGPELGIDTLKSIKQLDPRNAAKGSQNIFYQEGLLQTPYGFTKLDLTTGLNSGDIVLAVFPFTELDKYSHLIAVTTEKIYEHDRINEEWDNKTPTGVTYNSDINHPISYAEVGHDDTDIYIDDDTGKANSYHHLIVCDGSLSNIQRWAGRYEQDFGDLLGGGGYHDGTAHRALQVSMSQASRILLLSPREYNSSSKTWVENNQRVRWPTVGKIQTFTGTGSGFADLIETGGFNVWSDSLGSQHIIYQTKGIWTLNYVGGTTVFNPVPVIPDLGLLSYHLLVSYNNVHYFMGTDYNIHAYFGGTVRQTIGNPIHKFLREDLDTDYDYRCWMAMGPEGKRLWIFIVPSGSTYITKAYYRNMTSGAWGIRDFSSKFTSGGITAVSLVSAQSYITGDTYAEALNAVSPYAGLGGGDLVIRYGDFLIDSSVTLSAEITAMGSWCDGGLDCTKGVLAGNFSTDFTENDILRIADGSAGSNVEPGTHYYTCYDVSTNGFSVRPRHDEDCLKLAFNSGGTYQIRISDTIDGTTSAASACVAGVVVEGGAWADGDASGELLLTNQTGVFQAAETLNVGSNINVGANANAADSTLVGLVGVADASVVAAEVDVTGINTKAGHSGADAVFFSVCSDSNPGQTYRQVLDEVLTQPQLILGDSNGLVYQMDETYTDDDGALMDCRHPTPVFDWGLPDIEKKWPAITVTADGTVGGAMFVRYRTSNFDTSDTGWADYTFDLTSQRISETFWPNVTSKVIQFELQDFSGKSFRVPEFKIHEPLIESNR